MTGWEMLAVAAAGFAAGGINAVVGSGTLVSFPVLLAVGLPPVPATISNSLGLFAGAYATGTYGGYFAASQGVLQIGIFGLILRESLQRLNAIKNVLTFTVNAVAAAAYVVVATDQVDWVAAGLLAVGSLVGGSVGSRYGRRLPSWLLRTAIVVLGVVAIVVLGNR